MVYNDYMNSDKKNIFSKIALLLLILTATFWIVWGVICLARTLGRDNSDVESPASRGYDAGVFDPDEDEEEGPGEDEEGLDEDSTDDLSHERDDERESKWDWAEMEHNQTYVNCMPGFWDEVTEERCTEAEKRHYPYIAY